MKHRLNQLLVWGLGCCLIFAVFLGGSIFFIWNAYLIDSSGVSGSTPRATWEVIKFVLETPTTPTAELLPLQNVPSPTPLRLPEATFTLEPTPTATQVVIPTSTSIPTPLPLPTVTETSLPSPTVELIPTETPLPVVINHVVIISIDGLRPDAWEAADTPILDGLRAKGAYSPNAKSVLPSETMPNHASMLGGMTPNKHGIIWNLPYADAPRIKGPTLFSIAHEAGLRTAMVVGKSKLEYLVVPGSVDEFIGNDSPNTWVMDEAVRVIQAGLPNVLFIHFPDVDRVGHASGWMSPEQLQTVTSVDTLIGNIVNTLQSGGYLNSTLLIVTADHGGEGTTHEADLPANTTIPWLAVGPGVAKGLTLSSNIIIYDTAATALYALGLTIPETWDGRPVLEIFN